MRSTLRLGRVYTPCEREPERTVPAALFPRMAALPGRTDWLSPRVPEPCTTLPIEERRTALFPLARLMFPFVTREALVA